MGVLICSWPESHPFWRGGRWEKLSWRQSSDESKSTRGAKRTALLSKPKVDTARVKSAYATSRIGQSSPGLVGQVLIAGQLGHTAARTAADLVRLRAGAFVVACACYGHCSYIANLTRKHTNIADGGMYVERKERIALIGSLCRRLHA